MPSLDYLLGEISVDPPEERAAAVAAGNTSWPEGFWGVADEHHGYVAYFAFEYDAWAWRLFLINARMNLPQISERYAKPDEQTDLDDLENEHIEKAIGLLRDGKARNVAQAHKLALSAWPGVDRQWVYNQLHHPSFKVIKTKRTTKYRWSP